MCSNTGMPKVRCSAGSRPAVTRRERRVALAITALRAGQPGIAAPSLARLPHPRFATP